MSGATVLLVFFEESRGLRGLFCINYILDLDRWISRSRVFWLLALNCFLLSSKVYSRRAAYCHPGQAEDGEVNPERSARAGPLQGVRRGLSPAERLGESSHPGLQHSQRG